VTERATPWVVVLFAGMVLGSLLLSQGIWSRCLPVDRGQDPVGVGWLFGSNVVTQRIQASYSGLSKISVYLDRLPADGDLLLSLLAADEGLSGNAWSARASGDGGVYTLSFPRQLESAGREYLLVLQTTQTPESQRASLRVYPDDHIPDELLLNDTPTGGDLALRLCYRPKSLKEQRHYLLEKFWDHYDNLDTLLNRLSQYKPFYYKRPQWLGLLVLNVTALSWLGAFLWGQAFRQSPWSLRHSLHVALQLDTVAIVVLTAIALWSGRFEPVTELRASPTAGTEISPTDSTLLYDFAFAALSDPNGHVDTPEEWYVAYDWTAIGDDSRPVLKMHPPSAVVYDMILSEDTWLRGAAALHPDVWSPDKGDGVLFQIQVFSQEGEETVYYNEIDPKNLPDHRRWHDFEIDLSRYAGQRVTIKFLTYPLNSNDWDWAVWGAPVLVTR
jgi:hypothetical protein